MENGTREDKKRRWWSDPKNLERHAEKRRRKYETDPEYAEAERRRIRERYAETQGKTRVNRAAVALSQVAEPKTPKQISLLLERREDYINRLISRGLWPAPEGEGIYTTAQARRLLEAFAKHSEAFANYRANHTETTKALFAAMKEGQ